MSLITKFKKGDNIPEWILRAPSPEFQKFAFFNVDVQVAHGDNYSCPVVWPLCELSIDVPLAIIDYKTDENHTWSGAPTHWMNHPLASLNSTDTPQ